MPSRFTIGGARHPAELERAEVVGKSGQRPRGSAIWQGTAHKHQDREPHFGRGRRDTPLGAWCTQDVAVAFEVLSSLAQTRLVPLPDVSDVRFRVHPSQLYCRLESKANSQCRLSDANVSAQSPYENKRRDSRWAAPFHDSVVRGGQAGAPANPLAPSPRRIASKRIPPRYARRASSSVTQARRTSRRRIGQIPPTMGCRPCR